MTANQRAGSSRLLREINEAVALRHLLEHGRLTRGELRELTGLAKPTTTEVLRRLQEAGVATVAGRRSGGPGPNAAVYAVNPDAAFGAAVSLTERDTTLATAVCDLTGQVRARTATRVDFTRADPAHAVADVVNAACRHVGVPLRRLDHVQLGVPGSYHERMDLIRYVDVPGWSRAGLVGEIRARLRTRVAVDNDVNLAAVAERTRGVASGSDGFALLWLGVDGLGLAIDLGGALLRGARGGAGEIGYMPVGTGGEPGGGTGGEPGGGTGGGTGDTPDRPGDLRSLIAGPAVGALAAHHGIDAASGPAAVSACTGSDRPPGAAAFLDDLAARIALGLAAVIAVLDPPMVVLAGEVGRAGGQELADAVRTALRTTSTLDTPVTATALADEAVLLGGIDTTVIAVRNLLLGQ